jgi:hypothetical protein
MLIRIAAERQHVKADDAKVVPALVPMLQYGQEHAISLVVVEAILCLISQPDSVHRVRLAMPHQVLHQQHEYLMPGRLLTHSAFDLRRRHGQGCISDTRSNHLSFV